MTNDLLPSLREKIILLNKIKLTLIQKELSSAWIKRKRNMIKIDLLHFLNISVLLKYVTLCYCYVKIHKKCQKDLLEIFF